MKKNILFFLAGIAVTLLVQLFTYERTIIVVPEQSISFKLPAEVTWYNPDPAQTDDTPIITASGKLISEQTAACPEWLEFGTKIRVDGKDYVCEDRMNLRYRRSNHFDLAVMDYDEAIRLGRQNKVIEIVP